jgi:hypothetical protein
VGPSQNLLRDAWADLDQADLRLLLQERIGRPGQCDGDENVIHLPLAREKCRVSLTFGGSKIVAIEPGSAFDRNEWNQICAEIEGPLLTGPGKVSREFSFSTHQVAGSWRGERSGVQILPPPASAPRAHEGADNPFILEFPIRDAGLWAISNQRRIREHRRLTLLLNLLLIGTTKFLPDRRRNFWACVNLFEPEPAKKLEIKWVQEWFFADLGEAVVEELSPSTGETLEVLESEKYYKEVIGLDARGLRVPDDLDDSIYRYQNLRPTLQAKFDRAAYWLSIASRQWEDSMSASFASLVSAAEALTAEDGTKHSVYCDKCKENRTHRTTCPVRQRSSGLSSKNTPQTPG